MITTLRLGQIFRLEPTKKYEKKFNKLRRSREGGSYTAEYCGGDTIRVSIYAHMFEKEYFITGTESQNLKNMTKAHSTSPDGHGSWVVPDEFIVPTEEMKLDIREYSLNSTEKVRALLGRDNQKLLHRRLANYSNQVLKDPFKFLSLWSTSKETITDVCINYIKNSTGLMCKACGDTCGSSSFIKLKYVRHGSIFFKCPYCGTKSKMSLATKRQGVSFELTPV